MEKRNEFIESFGLSRIGKNGGQRLVFKNLNKGSIKIQIQNRDNDNNQYHWKDDGYNAISTLLQRWDIEKVIAGLSLVSNLYKKADKNNRRIKVAENKKNLLIISYKFNEELDRGEIRLEIFSKETQKDMKFNIKGSGIELIDDSNSTIHTIDNTVQSLEYLINEIRYRHGINVSALDAHIRKCYSADNNSDENSKPIMPF